MTAYLNQCGIVCALGEGTQAVRAALLRAESGVVPTERYSPGRALPLGLAVHGELPSLDHYPLRLRSRNNQIALAALAQIRPAVDAAIATFGATRVAVIIGTSTSGIGQAESALFERYESGALPAGFHYGQQEMGSPAEMLAEELGIRGPAYVHSSACSSSAKAMASAARLLEMGICDAVVAGGVDTLCRFTVAGFTALDSVSTERCNPLSAHRKGINIGEGAALFLMTRERAPVALLGWGESSDGYHISAPDPSGEGARLAIEQALRRAGTAATGVDYVNLHGTATVQNDAMESKVLAGLFGAGIPMSSTKPLTGHALGAAGAIEAALCWMLMQDDNPDGLLPPHVWDGTQDATLPALALAQPGARLGRPLSRVLSNSFAFGGSNAALVFGRDA